MFVIERAPYEQLGPAAPPLLLRLTSSNSAEDGLCSRLEGDRGGAPCLAVDNIPSCALAADNRRSVPQCRASWRRSPIASSFTRSSHSPIHCIPLRPNLVLLIVTPAASSSLLLPNSRQEHSLRKMRLIRKEHDANDRWRRRSVYGVRYAWQDSSWESPVLRWRSPRLLSWQAGLSSSSSRAEDHPG